MTQPDIASAADDVDAGVLAHRYRGALLLFFQRRLRNQAEAEDLAQEVLLRLTTRQARFPGEEVGEIEPHPPPGQPRQTRTSYIFMTARSVLMDKLRRDQVRERKAHCGLENADRIEVPSAERVYTAQERIERVSHLLNRLTPRVREVFAMHRIEGLAYSEIAQALGISVSTVEKHMIAALRFIVQHAAEIE